MPIYKTNIKKDGRQQYRVRINYTNAAGAHKQVERTAYGKAEAQDLERVLFAEFVNAPEVLPSMTVAELVASYLVSHTPEVRTTTITQYKGQVNRYVLPVLGDRKLDDLTPECLRNWKNTMNAKKLSVTTRKNAYAALRATLNYAVELKKLPENPLRHLPNFRDPNSAPKRDKLQYYTTDQFRLYIAKARQRACDLRSWGLYTFFCIAYYTGMRKGEINALRWGDIDGNIIHVRRSVAQKIRGEAIIETPPKNKTSYRDLQMPTPLLTVLEQQKTRQQADTRWTEEYRVCGGIGCIADTTIDHYNRKIAEAAGLPRIRVHDFRHSHASLLVNEGINIQEVARRLGHSDVQMTWNTYSHLYPREEERAVAVLNGITLPVDTVESEKIPEKSPKKSCEEN